jgi:hypothetical protein
LSSFTKSLPVSGGKFEGAIEALLRRRRRKLVPIGSLLLGG